MSQPLRWTTAKPTEAGWYWWQGPWFGPEIICVYQPNGPDTDNLAVFDGKPLEELGNGQWAGPITLPEWGEEGHDDRR